MCTVKPCYILAERPRLFAVRLPSLSQGNGLLGCGITFDIFTHVLHRSFFFFFFFATIVQKRKCTYDDLVDGYNVAHLQYKT